MKKIINFLVLSLLVLFPLKVFAFTELEDYNTLNLEDTLKEESIDLEFDNYEETDDQITIYLFRGKRCGYCRAFLTFLNSITEEYGKYFKLVSFETWNDTQNKDLLNETSTFLGESINYAVPYIIIGEKTFNGYTSDWDEDIKDAIMDQYESKDRYDVFEEMKKGTKTNVVEIVIWVSVINAVFLVIILGTMSYQNNKINIKLEEIYDILNTNKQDTSKKEENTKEETKSENDEDDYKIVKITKENTKKVNKKSKSK